MSQTKRFLLLAVLLSCSIAGKNFSAGQNTQEDSVRRLIDRQARAWEKQDFRIAASDWLPTGVFISPIGSTPASELPKSMSDYFKNFTNVKVTVNDFFLSSDAQKVAIEWQWAVTRKRDGNRGISHDAIIIHLSGGKIASWREYYDPVISGEANP